MRVACLLAEQDCLWVLVQCLLYSRHVRSTQKEQKTTTKWWRSAGCLTRSESCPGQGSVVWVLFKVLTILMSDYEEDLNDFPTENPNTTADSMVGTFRTESTDQWTASSGITSKIPPLFDGSTSWFKCETLTEYWLDLTVLEESKRGPALKNRLVGAPEIYKGLSQESLRAEDGVKYFRDTLRPHFIK